MRGGPRLRSLLLNGALMVVASALLTLAIYSNRDQLRDVFSRPLDVRLFAAAFATYMLALVLTFYRWFLLVRALELPFRYRDALRLGFIGNVFNLVIPGAVGGDLVKAAFLCREQARRTQAVASMAIDRILGLLGLFLLAGVSGAAAWGSADPDVRRLVIVVWAAAACGLFGLAVIFTPGLYRPFHRLFHGRGKLELLFDELVIMAAAYRRRLGTVGACLALAVVGHALYVLAFYQVSRALFPSAVPSLGAHFLMVPLALFTTAVPLPFGALGLSEQVSGRLFRLVDHPGGAVAMMGFRVLMYASGAVGALVYFANASQMRSLRTEAVTALNAEEDPPVV